MINMDYVASEVQSILAMLDAGTFPEVYHYLTGILDEDGSVSDGPLVIANTLTGLDKPQVFPEFLIGFIEDMYQLEIAEGNDDAMNDLGAQYYDGSRGFEQSFDKAVMYFR